MGFNSGFKVLTV